MGRQMANGGSSAAIQNRMAVHKYMLVFYSVILRFVGVKLSFKMYKVYFIGRDTKNILTY